MHRLNVSSFSIEVHLIIPLALAPLLDSLDKEDVYTLTQVTAPKHPQLPPDNVSSRSGATGQASPLTPCSIGQI